MKKRLRQISAALLAVILCSAGMADIVFAANTDGGEYPQRIHTEETLYNDAEAPEDSEGDMTDQGAVPADTDCGEQLTWSIDENGLLTITGTGDMKEWTEDDPAPWYELADSVKEIQIEDEVKTIGSYAFADLTNVEKVTIGSGIKSIGVHAFTLCGDENTVYVYNGTETDWSSVEVGEDNDVLDNATFETGDPEETLEGSDEAADNPDEIVNDTEGTEETTEEITEDTSDTLGFPDENTEDLYGIETLASSVLATPALGTATASSGKITITWSSVSGASGYRVYRKTSGGSWAAIGNTTGATSYVDGKVDPGTTYYYTVRAYKGDYSTALANTYDSAYWSDFVAAGVSTKAAGVLSTPSLKSAASTGGNVTVSWNAVSGASGYRVYRKTSGGSWTAIGNATGLSYTDGKADADTTYYYTVRAYKGDYSTALANAHYAQYWSDFDSAGKSAKAAGVLSTPSLKSASASAGQIKVTWNAVSGASGYRVYRKTSSSSWAAIGYTTGTSYTDSNKLDVGTTYYYTVRAYKGDYFTAVANAHYAQYWSGFVSAGVSDKAVSSIATPSLKNASCTGGKITVTWNSVSGASGYRVYRKTSSSSWAAIATSTVTNYTDEKVDADTTYYYTVRAYQGDKDTALANAHYAEYWSDFVSAGVSTKAVSVLSTPTLVSAILDSGKVTVKWNSVSNASGYRIYRKTSSGSWSAIDSTTATSYTDSSISSGTNYIYTVRAYKGDYSTALANAHYASYWSGFDSAGISTGPGIVKNGSTYYYVDSTGMKVTTTCIQQAVDFVVAHTTDSWSDSKKLEECFNYLWKNYTYKRSYETPSASSMNSYAEDMFTNKQGNCYRYAASFACIAAVLGYDARVAVGQISSTSGGMTAHGWTEVKVSGTWYICDANMQMNHPSINSYMRTESNYAYKHTCSARYTLTLANGKATWK